MSFNDWEKQQYGQWDNPNSNFGYEQQFQSFDYSQQQQQVYSQNSLSEYTSQQPSYFIPGPNIMTPQPHMEQNYIDNQETSQIEDEPPLLEELGIDIDAIFQKTLNVLNPLRHTPSSVLQDTDLAGPLVFCLAFGSLLLLSGKVHFGYIYGFGLMGCLSLYGLLNMMSTQGASFGVVVSVLGYCILPMVGLAAINVIMSLQGVFGSIFTGCAIIWCSWSASKLFVTALEMHHQQPLVAYPCALFYAVFALITIF